MRKINLVIFFFSISFSQTGNDFLMNFPFGKDVKKMSPKEYGEYVYYRAYVNGFRHGNGNTLAKIRTDLSEESYNNTNLFLKTYDMGNDQLLAVIKKWCDDNPDKTNKVFFEILWLAFLELPNKSINVFDAAKNK